MADLDRANVHHQRRTPLAATGLNLLVLSFQTLGIIYSDIGTSPLYVLNGIWPSTGPIPSKQDVIGGISAIIWSLTLLPLTKYVFIVLRFGTGEGEGGTFSLFQGLYPPVTHNVDADRVLTGDSAYKQNSSKSGSMPERLRWPLLLWCLLGTGLTMADGIFTPAVSVTSAVGGIAVAKPSVSNSIIPISIAFLVALFLIQPFGTARIASVFAPVTFVWLALLASTGIVNIISYPGIFRAFDPSRAVMLFVRTGKYDLLAGILLAVTGCEALFANLGQFTRLSIQLSFSSFVYPCLVLAYLGQGSRLIVDGPNVISNVFYQTIPGPANGPLFWIVYVFGILATLIASQAMITATFSLVQQLVNMKSLPPIHMVYTSDKIQGQVYVPIVNWILMIATVILVAAFKNLQNLTSAYGFAVSTVMFSTSLLIAIHIRHVKQLPVFLAIAFFIFFGFFDGLFWGASFRKVPRGAWVPLILGCLLLCLMAFWTWAKALEDKFDGDNRRNLKHFITTEDDGQVTFSLQPSNGISTIEEHSEKQIVKETTYRYVSRDSDHKSAEGGQEKEERRELVRIPICAVFYKLTSGKGIPHSFVELIKQWPALPRVVIFLSVRVLPVPRISEEYRYVVDKVRSVEGFYGVTYFLGYREDIDVKIDEVIHRICSLESGADPCDCSETINAIKSAALSVTHIMPRYHVKSRRVDVGRWSPVINWVRKFMLEELYRPFAAMFIDNENWNSSSNEIIRIGISASI